MKLRSQFLIAALATALAAPAAFARESWPAQTEEAKKTAEAAAKREDEVWKKIQPEVQEWAKKGKPFIPSAAKPEDLPQADIVAFPGAEGGGAHSFGGRGGRVFVVTSLDDDGPGTLREACEAAGPRIVVFNVAGKITLKNRIRVRAPYLTIDGAKAPGDGVVVSGNTLAIDTHDVVIRYMRFRRGAMDVYNRDDALGGNPVGNIIIDHCSCSWGFDENLSMYRHMYDPGDGTKEMKLPTVNITIQWTISSEALNTWNHAFGGTWGGRNDTFHHDLFACNTGRNCSMGLGGDFNYVNNVIFNWRHRTVDGGDNTTQANIINNYYKPGPITNTNAPIGHRIVKGDTQRGKNIPLAFGKFYVAGNIVEGNEQVTNDNWSGGVQIIDVGDKLATDESPEKILAGMKVEKPFPMAKITIQPAKEAYEAVLANVGATLPKRDAVDARVIEEVRSGKADAGPDKNGIITDIAQVGGYPEYKGEPYKDSDHDGMPDEWESKYGLNPNDPSDASKDSTGDGYTNIEKFLYDLDPTKKKVAAASSDDATLAADKQPAAATDKEAEYTAAINKRADDIIKLLDITDASKSQKVHDILTSQYRALRDWHDANDAKLKAKDLSADDKTKIQSSLKELHDTFLTKLSAELSPEQVEKVKDKMVYGKVQVTYNAYAQMIGTLSDEQKAKILSLLKDAREEAIDGGSAEEKSAIFKKYKGKINNYLATQNIDMKKVEKEWGQKQKEQKAASAANSTTQEASK